MYYECRQPATYVNNICLKNVYWRTHSHLWWSQLQINHFGRHSTFLIFHKSYSRTAAAVIFVSLNLWSTNVISFHSLKNWRIRINLYVGANRTPITAEPLRPVLFYVYFLSTFASYPKATRALHDIAPPRTWPPSTGPQWPLGNFLEWQETTIFFERMTRLCR